MTLADMTDFSVIRELRAKIAELEARLAVPLPEVKRYFQMGSAMVESKSPPGHPGTWVEYGDYQRLAARNAELEAKLNTPELADFSAAVVLEAAHQRERWGTQHDIGKEPSDWFWLVGYLAGKALASQIAGNAEKALHHTISTAAALCNWHSAITGNTNMQPGHAPSAARGDAAIKASEPQGWGPPGPIADGG